MANSPILKKASRIATKIQFTQLVDFFLQTLPQLSLLTLVLLCDIFKSLGPI